jgi:uncharacterized protein YkwD
MSGRFALIATIALICAALTPSFAGATGLAHARVVDTATGLTHARVVDRSVARTAVVIDRGGCPTHVPLDAPPAIQEQAMLCLTNQMRERYGEAPLQPVAQLEESAAEKSADVLGCGLFSHEACGREFTYWIRASGYLDAECWRVGENLAWGGGEYGTVDSIFRAWMRSQGHRENILGDYTQTGIALEVGSLGNVDGVHLWAQHFGSHCEAPPSLG